MVSVGIYLRWQLWYYSWIKPMTLLRRARVLALTMCDLNGPLDCLSLDILLLKKLSLYGVQGSSHKIVLNYLANINQAVSLEGAVSCCRPVRYDEPWRSVLGPLIFLSCALMTFTCTARRWFLLTISHSWIGECEPRRYCWRLMKLLAPQRTGIVLISSSRTMQNTIHPQVPETQHLGGPLVAS